MIVGGTDAESAAKGLLSIAGCPGLIWQNVNCAIVDLLDYFSLVKRPARLNAMISLEYFPIEATRAFGRSAVRGSIRRSSRGAVLRGPPHSGAAHRLR